MYPFVLILLISSISGGLADWCLLDNGGCAQICNNQCGRKTSCSCLPGYKLAYDGKACIGEFLQFNLPV